MSEFHNDNHDKPFALLFNSHAIEENFISKNTGIIHTVIKDKEETRLMGMLSSASEIGLKFIDLQKSAIAAIAIARSEDEYLAMSFGILKIIPGGVAICPTCLNNAILTCQENLEVLKDIQEAVSKYAHTQS